MTGCWVGWTETQSRQSLALSSLFVRRRTLRHLLALNRRIFLTFLGTAGGVS